MTAVTFTHHAGSDTATARGATRKNGGAAILKARGWYWLNSVQVYVIKDKYVAPRTAAQEVREAAAMALRMLLDRADIPSLSASRGVA